MLVREFKRQKLDLNPPRLMPTLDSLLAHVRAGQGWTLMPRLFVPKLAPLAGVRIEDFQAPFRTVRTWRRADSRPVTRTVLTELRALQQVRLSELGASSAPAVDPGREFVPARLDLRHLRSFVQVAELGSLGRAAESLDITQPALSRQMRELEYDIGTQLLERGTRGVELTPAGRALHPDAQGILAVVDQIAAEVKRAQRGAQERRCVIGVVPHPHVDTLVALAVSEMEGRAPRVRVGTRAVDSPLQPEALRASEIDIGIGFAYPARVPSQTLVTRVRILDDEMNQALLAIDHPLATRESVSLADLANVPFIFPERTFFPPLYDVVMHQFESANVTPRRDAEYQGLQTIWALTAQGLGWALGWKEQAHQPPPGTKCIRIRDFHLPWGVELSYRRDESRAPILATIDTIIESARQLFPSKVPASIAKLGPVNASNTLIS